MQASFLPFFLSINPPKTPFSSLSTTRRSTSPTMEEEREEGELSPPLTPKPSSAATGATWPFLRFDLPPRRALHFHRQFFLSDGGNSNFLKCLRWSPDGSSFLTSADDNSLRVFALPGEVYGDLAGVAEASVDGEDSYGPSVVVSEAESVYDFCWYPYMSAADPATCVFASTTRDHPIHLWDAFTGELRCTYRAYDAMDEITVALSVAFDSSGTKTCDPLKRKR